MKNKMIPLFFSGLLAVLMMPVYGGCVDSPSSEDYRVRAEVRSFRKYPSGKVVLFVNVLECPGSVFSRQEKAGCPVGQRNISLPLSEVPLEGLGKGAIVLLIYHASTGSRYSHDQWEFVKIETEAPDDPSGRNITKVTKDTGISVYQSLVNSDRPSGFSRILAPFQANKWRKYLPYLRGAVVLGIFWLGISFIIKLIRQGLI